jgi:hypothetical protein
MLDIGVSLQCVIGMRTIGQIRRRTVSGHGPRRACRAGSKRDACGCCAAWNDGDTTAEIAS